MVAWKEVSVRRLNLAWTLLWPDAMAPREFEGFQQMEEEPAVQEIVSGQFHGPGDEQGGHGGVGGGPQEGAVI